MRGNKSLGAIVFASLALAIAIAAPAGQAQLPICQPGTTNTQYCQIGPPVLSAHALSAACRASGARVTVPSTAITSVAGIKTIKVTLDGRKVKSVSLKSVKSFTLKNVVVKTRGLRAGLHTIVVTVTDSGGRTSKRIFHFTICRPKPKFTG